MPFCVLKHFLGNSWRHKSDYLINENWNTQKVCFSYHVLKGKNPEENLNLYKQLYFDQTSKRAQILTKTVFLPNVGHILLNYAFLLFWSIFWEIHWELFFLDIKVTISETSTEILRNFVFLTMLKRDKSWGKFRFV